MITCCTADSNRRASSTKAATSASVTSSAGASLRSIIQCSFRSPQNRDSFGCNCGEIASYVRLLVRRKIRLLKCKARVPPILDQNLTVRDESRLPRSRVSPGLRVYWPAPDLPRHEYFYKSSPGLLVLCGGCHVNIVAAKAADAPLHPCDTSAF